ncbi:hypothetical protein AGLY_014785 [Aphis glycines]|uniref:Uncharacterized protein n=1 Tax=Aphis glycines TaxID=307491 RepID=A0A6G0T315_APHGL|nr:hypothetical protein AGLY_014785 [Aphis glycines]
MWDEFKSSLITFSESCFNGHDTTTNPTKFKSHSKSSLFKFFKSFGIAVISFLASANTLAPRPASSRYHFRGTLDTCYIGGTFDFFGTIKSFLVKIQFIAFKEAFSTGSPTNVSSRASFIRIISFSTPAIPSTIKASLVKVPVLSKQHISTLPANGILKDNDKIDELTANDNSTGNSGDSFICGIDSPVNKLSSTIHEPLKSNKSQGTVWSLLVLVIDTISPGVSSSLNKDCHFLLR